MKPTEVQAASVQQVKSKDVIIMYKVNPSAYASAFVLPAQVADKHLRMAGKAQLKVLLWLYRNAAAEYDIDVVSRDTGIPRDEIDDAMLYWLDAGLVIKDGESPKAVASPVSASQELRNEAKSEPAKEVREPVREPKKEEKAVIVKPSIKDIAMRLNESAEIAAMFNEVQEIFGRTLGYDVQSNLLILHDHYGLPAEVIVMLCSYAKTVGKQGAVAYIVQMGKAWADEGITDFDSAGKKIARMENAQNIWGDFRRMTGVENPRPTSKQAELLEIWINDYSYSLDVIHYAYEKTVEKKGKISFGYMNGILRSWFESGLKTVEDIENAQAEFAGKQKKETVKKASVPQTSYDVALAMKRSLAVDPNKTKRGQ